MEKSCLVISQAQSGVTLDGLAMTAKPSSHFVEDILHLLAQFQEGHQFNYVMFLHHLGKLTYIVAGTSCHVRGASMTSSDQTTHQQCII